MEQIDEKYVLQAARLVGIELTREQLPGVIVQLRRTTALASSVNEFTLPTDAEIAPTWRP